MAGNNITPGSRTAAGKFAKGYSGNPLGIGRAPNIVRNLARQYTEAAIEALAEALSATKIVGMAAEEVPDHPTRINAAKALLERGYGSPLSEEVVSRDDAASDSAPELQTLSSEQIEKLEEILRDN